MASLQFLIDMLPGPLRRIPTHMDYEGQKYAEKVFQVIITICAVIGFVWGYKEQKYSYTVYTTLGGFFLSCLVTIPPWPVFRVRKDLVWQKPLPTMTDTDTTKPAAKKIKAKKDN